MKKIKNILLLLAIIPTFSYALLEITIIKSEEDKFKIVIAPFELQGDMKEEMQISNIILDNLNKSGNFDAINSNIVIKDRINFDYWNKNDQEAIVFGKIEKINNNLFNIYIYVYDIYTKNRIYGKKITTTANGNRRIAHYLSDKIHNVILGEKGSFDTRLTYVSVSDKEKGNKIYNLEISDSDGHNAQTVIQSYHPIFSPAWSPDQKKIAYVSFRNKRSDVYIKYPFMRVKTIKLPRFDGIASSPAWHPDGSGLALTISKDGNKDIYLYNLTDKKLTRLTNNTAIDTEANFSPDGNSIAFTSNRSGQVQVYIKNLVTGVIKRATFEGSYNADPVFSPDGKSLALIHRIGKDYRVALLDIETRDLTVLTENKLDESPYFSPNGGMIVFAKNEKNKGVLSVISLSNNQIVEFSKKEYEIREPSWSNYSK